MVAFSTVHINAHLEMVNSKVYVGDCQTMHRERPAIGRRWALYLLQLLYASRATPSILNMV